MKENFSISTGDNKLATRHLDALRNANFGTMIIHQEIRTSNSVRCQILNQVALLCSAVLCQRDLNFSNFCHISVGCKLAFSMHFDDSNNCQHYFGLYRILFS